MTLLENLIAQPLSHFHQQKLRSAIRSQTLGPLLGEKYREIRFVDKPALLNAQTEIIDLITGQMNSVRLVKLLKDIQYHAG